MRKDCNSSPLNSSGGFRTSLQPPNSELLGAGEMVNGQGVRALVGTGCTLTIASSRLAQDLPLRDDHVALEMMDCSLIRPLGSVELQNVWVDGRQLGPLRPRC